MLEKLRRRAEVSEVAPKKRLALHVSMPLLVVGIIILAFTLGWAFFMGFLVGRGEDPGTRLNSLPIFGGKPPENVQKPPKEAPKKEPEVPEAAVAKVPEETKEPAKPVHPFTRPKDAGLNAWGNRHAKTEPAKDASKDASKDVSKDAAKGAAKDADDQHFEIRYQVASFPNESDAQDLSKRCQARGLNAIAQRRGQVYRVVITHKGTRAEAMSLRGKVRGLGIKDWLVIYSQSLDQANKTDKRPR